mmetsp:Transcript_10441/g.63850  ORF Transcript_10441/g.63850 Transcript_10441/m.63850 type:complete len:204 (+) Transcript_10441:990-1601(+)
MMRNRTRQRHLFCSGITRMGRFRPGCTFPRPSATRRRPRHKARSTYPRIHVVFAHLPCTRAFTCVASRGRIARPRASSPLVPCHERASRVVTCVSSCALSSSPLRSPRVRERIESNLRPPPPAARAPCRPGDAPWACAGSCRRISRRWTVPRPTHVTTTAVFRVRHVKRQVRRIEWQRTRRTWRRFGRNQKQARTGASAKGES